LRFVPSSKYAAAFGLQWLKYRLTQLDSHTGVPLSGERLRRCLGEDLWGRLAGSSVLEVGCGAGRFTEILLKENSRVASIDLSEAVEANQKNFRQSDSHVIAQADVYALPFLAEQFDIVLCLGVIQHTPSPEKTIASLWRQVKPGGHLVIDHYTYNWSYYTKTAPLFRAILKRVDPLRALSITDALVHYLLPLHRAARRFYPLQALLSRVSPVQAYYHALPSLSDVQQLEWAMLDTHDTLTDWYKHFRTGNQIKRFLSGLGAVEILVSKGGNGIEARAIKPS
jgi:SAM-dependent methyltransferase